jgi:CO/xanthine dehydrogenase FAD-binding subunit
MFTIRNYKKAESLEEAWQLNQQRGNRIGGGMLWLKMGKGNVQTFIDLSGLGLDTIEESEEEFRIGCMVTLRDLEKHEGLQTYTGGALREALRHIVGVQFRNLATVGGSVFGRFGFSDVLTMLAVMNSYVELYKGGVIPMEEFIKKEYDRDVLVRILIKKTPASFSYISVRNTETDFPVLTCAAAWYEKRGLLLAVGARPEKAFVLRDRENLIKDTVTEENARAFADYAAEQIKTGSNLRGSAEYRSHLIRVLTHRAVMRFAEQ